MPATRFDSCIVFDWNGTLLADTRIVYECTNHVLRNLLDHPGLDFAAYRASYDMPISRIYLNAGIPADVFERRKLEIGHHFHDAYQRTSNKARLRRGARALIDDLNKHGVGAVILSNHIVSEIERHLSRLGLNGQFTSVLANASREEQVHFPDKGDRLAAFMDQHKLDKKRVLIVGDSPEEPILARRFGITGIAITDGHVSTPRLRAASPHHLINHLREVGDIAHAAGFIARGRP